MRFPEAGIDPKRPWTWGRDAMRLADIVLDNPILVKHARSRLRLWQVMPWAVIVLVMSVSAAWAGQGVNWIGHASAVVIVLGLQILLLGFGGTNQFTASL